jgi:hypothetical protein
VPRNDNFFEEYGSALLPVVDQDLAAGLADPGAVLLQARQHRIVAIIHYGPAMAGDVAGAGIVPRPLLGRGRREQKTGQNKRNDQKKSGHLVGPPTLR